MHRLLRIAILAILLPLLPSNAARAQASDTPLRIVWPFAAGGGGDALARILAEQLRPELGRPVIVENRAGADGRIGVQAVKTAAADGSTLLMTPIAPMAVFQHVYRTLAYDPFKDFQAVSQLATFDFALAVGSQAPVKTLAEYIAWAKADAARGTYGVPAAGSLPHFFAALFSQMNGLDLTYIAYKGTPDALNDMFGGHLPALFTSTNQILEMHKAGRVRILATSDAGRSSFLPDVPTFREAGYPIEGTGWFGVFAPAATPAPVIERLSGSIATIIQRPDMRQRITALGLHPTGTTAAAFAAIQRADAERWAPAVKASGFTAEQ